MEQVSNGRLSEIEALLRRNPSGLTSTEIAEALEVDASTIRRDLARLSSQGIEIHKRGRRYHIKFHRAMHTLRLTPDEVLVLYLACRLLSRQQSNRNPHAEEVMKKLAETVQDDAPRFANYIEDAALVQRLLPLDEKYLMVLETLTQAWSEAHIVEIQYRDRNGDLTNRRFHPYCIEPYGPTNSCYTIGFDELRNELRTFKLDRVVSAQLTDEGFTIPININPNRLFAEAWGVIWRETSLQTVELLFSGDTAKLAREAFWHPSQRIKEQPDGSCLITFQVSEPLEMKTWILQWGASVEVVSPPGLRKVIIEEIRHLAMRYTEQNISPHH
jgi:proteasome accessory factor B